MINKKLATLEIEKLITLQRKTLSIRSLDRIVSLLDRLGRPQDRLPPVIHIAGTNGKGSTAAFCRSLCEAIGLSVHVHTSPHLIEWHERFRLGVKGGAGRFVDDDVLLDVLHHVERVNNGDPITFFEISVAIAFILFSEYPADISIIEVGLGGRIDATNVIENPAVSIITSISLDHEFYLGNNVSLIAKEKAGIIKNGFPVVIGHQPYDEAREVLIAAAEVQKSPYSVYGKDFSVFEKNGRLIYMDQVSKIDLPIPSLLGYHQYFNASTAIRALQIAGLTLKNNDIEKAFLSVEWFGRLQKVSQGSLLQKVQDGSEIWIDGGHNPDAGVVISKFISQLSRLQYRPLYLIIGMKNDKNHLDYFKQFSQLPLHVFTISLPLEDSFVNYDNNQKSADPVMLAQKAREAGLEASPASSVYEALSNIKRMNSSSIAPRILIGGSLYLVGNVLSESGILPK